ncbi:MAG TPA: hypothetical protein VG095_04280 [Chthoniobacterales bacterium]|nr:hypothetical protein [Chthoniobacterales bacterium]
MNQIAGIPYVAAQFDAHGKPLNAAQVKVPPGTTDLIVVSHGWNNTAEQAEALYRELFTNFAAVASDVVRSRKLAIIGVIWPSKRFTDVVDAAVAEHGTGAGGGVGLVDNAAAAEETIRLKLDLIGEMFGKKAAAKIKAAKAQIAKLETDPRARDKFVNELRSLLDASEAHDEDNSKLFFRLKGSSMLERLKVPTPVVAAPPKRGGGATSLRRRGAAQPAGGAAGLGDIFSGFRSGAIRFLNYFTYYEMKKRAGTVGRNGVGPMLDRLADKVQRIHLVGHSFGGRVVTAAAAGSRTEKLRSMALLQTAFSHHGFSRSMKGFFREVVDRQRIKGPILITHTPNDRAVGVAYPAASRLSRDVSTAFGDANDKFGGIGRNGAQKMETGEIVSAVNQLLPVGGKYAWKAGRLHNLESSKFIVGVNGGDAHGAVTGKEVAWAISRAMA